MPHAESQRRRHRRRGDRKPGKPGAEQRAGSTGVQVRELWEPGFRISGVSWKEGRKTGNLEHPAEGKHISVSQLTG